LVRRLSLVVIVGVAIVLAACSSASQLPTFTYTPVASAADTTPSQVARLSGPVYESWLATHLVPVSCSNGKGVSG
jgi:hypothetical protein